MPQEFSDDWALRAKCRGMEDALFPEGADQKRARAICVGCPVRSECLAEALDNRIEWGVWGGMTERERRQLLRQRTDIESWKAVLLGEPARRARAEAEARQKRAAQTRAGIASAQKRPAQARSRSVG